MRVPEGLTARKHCISSGDPSSPKRRALIEDEHVVELSAEVLARGRIQPVPSPPVRDKDPIIFTLREVASGEKAPLPLASLHISDQDPPSLVLEVLHRGCGAWSGRTYRKR